MPLFEYRGLNASGNNVRGTLDSDNVRNARLKLKKDGIYVTEIKDKTKKVKKTSGKSLNMGQSVSVQDLSIMTRQLATMIKANIPLVDSLSAVAEQSENLALKEALTATRDMVNEGKTFHQALAKYPKLFDNIYISMCEAGEMSGTLDVILIRLTEFTEAMSELKQKVTNAMMYPVIMLFMSFGMLMFMFVVVIPKIMTIFESANMTLPWYSQIVINLSGFMVNYWHLIIIAGFASVIVFRQWASSEAGSEKWDAIKLNIPVAGPIIRMIAVSRFTRTLSTLLVGGVPMLNALEIVRKIVNNKVLAKAVEEARANISEGESIAGPLKKSGQFPPVVIHMVNIGEKTGELENMLTQVADSFDFQVNAKIDGLTSILAPVMIVVMGGVIGIIVVSILVPMIQLSSAF